MDIMSIAPTKNLPLQRVVNQLLDDIQDRIPDCRRGWWMTNRTACLTNQWARVAPDGSMELLLKPRPGAKQITDATYDPLTGWLLVSFQDGTRTELGLRP